MSEEEEYLQEIRDIVKGRYYSYALEKFQKWEGKDSKEGKKIKKQIYEGIYKDSIEYIDKKILHLRKYVDNHNFYRLNLETKVVERNLDHLQEVLSSIDIDDNKFLTQHRIYQQNAHSRLEEYLQKLNMMMKKQQDKIEKEKREKIIKKIDEKKAQFKVMLLPEPLDGNHRDKIIEYLPFWGVTTIRFRVVVNEPVKNLWIRPRITPDLFSKNVEWSNYVCGLNNEHNDFNIRNGFITTYGGGNLGGFYIGEVKDHSEKYVFFFLRHHDMKLNDIIDFSISFDAVEESDWTQEILYSITLQLKYPEDIRPETKKSIPDLNDPKCPVYPVYDYEFENFRGRSDKKYKEIRFQGNMLANYYPRWIPPRKVKYEIIKESLQNKLKNLVVRTYPSGDVRIWYYFGNEARLIGHLKGKITDAVFYDPLNMVTVDCFRFLADDLIALRVWFWWIDLRINDKKFRMYHEMPDFERVDFVIDLRNPARNGNMIKFIATDVHWKEFWLDTTDIDKVVDVKFTPIGINLVNWKQLVAFFSHHVGILYNPLPAVINRLFSSIGDKKNFYCVACGERTEPPSNIAAIREMIEEFKEIDLGEQKYAEKTQKIMENELTDLMCPSCHTLIRKHEKLQYMYLFEDFSTLHKHLNDEILQDALKKETKEGGVGLSFRIQNCHVPTPADGKTSHEWVSSTVIKPLLIKEIESDLEYETNLKKSKLDHYDITNLEGLNSRIAARLYNNGIIKLRELVNASKDNLQNNINLTGLNEKEKAYYFQNIFRWKDMAELYQIKGVRSQYSDLLVEIGMNLKSLREFSGEPEELLRKIVEYNEIHNDVSRLPGLNDIKSWIEQAKAL